MSEKLTVIKVEHIGKKYIIKQNQKKAAPLDGKAGGFDKHLFNPLKRQTKEDFWALKDVSFEIKQGERVGIIGKNGAGKSTMLKLLSRITEPTKGRIELLGKVSAMLEVGTGFNPELTGRENVYLNGAILGMSKTEINEKFDKIVEFSEIGKFLDTPVKRYSSGMYVRLAFAVASHLEPDILIIDEVLAVGDQKFRQKCLDRMNEIAQGNKTILCVSHQMNVIRDLCDRVIVLQSGEVVYDGDVEGGVKIYLGDEIDTNADYINLNDFPRSPYARDLIHFNSLEVLNSEERLLGLSSLLKIKIDWLANIDISGAKIRFCVNRLDGPTLGVSSSDIVPDNKAGQLYSYTFDFDTSILYPGNYKATIALYQSDQTGLYLDFDIVINCMNFQVVELKGFDKSKIYKYPNWGDIWFPNLETI